MLSLWWNGERERAREREIERYEGDTDGVGLHPQELTAPRCSRWPSVLVLVSREWAGFCHIWHIITQWQSARTYPFLSLSFCPALFLNGTVPVVVWVDLKRESWSTWPPCGALCLSLCMWRMQSFRSVVQLEVHLTLSFTHPHVVPHMTFSSVDHKRRNSEEYAGCSFSLSNN